jgi:hypothetical protein
MNRMRKTTLMLLLTGIFILAVAVSAQATINQYINFGNGNGTEENLWNIISGWTGQNVTQSMLEGATTQTTIPNIGQGYQIIAYAQWAAYTQQFGVYAGNTTAPTSAPGPNPRVTLTSGGDFTTGFLSTPIKLSPLAGFPNATAPLAFYDAADSIATPLNTQLVYTSGLGTYPGTSFVSGLIFNLSTLLGPAYNGYIVAFEDGDGTPPTGDWDYNDFVAYIRPVPLPPSALLLGTGLLGLVGLRWRKGRAG